MKDIIEQLIQKALTQCFKNQGTVFPSIQIERPRDPTHGDFSCNIAMLLTKTLQMPPREIANILIQHMQHPDIETITLAGPGFINFTLKMDALITRFEALWTSSTCGIQTLNIPEIVVIDYSSPNLAKEMHVGHLRSTIIGDALARTFETKGYRVIRQNHVGDWGTQFGMLLAHLEENTLSASVALQDLENFYKAAKQRFDADLDFADRARQKVVQLQSGDVNALNLWKQFIQLSLNHCQAVYEQLGVSLTEQDVRAESAYNPNLPQIIQILASKQLLTENEGAQCVFLDQFKGKQDEPLPIIVQKKDGGFLYATTDLAAIQFRQETLHANRVLYVVDIRQSLHFQQIFALAYLAEFAHDSMKLEHISFGMVLDKQGKPFKSREGGTTKLVDLLNEAVERAKRLIQERENDYSPEDVETMAKVIGISAIKYADLSKHRTSDYMFDWDTMLSFEGNTAPYLLYAYTRIQSIFQKAGSELSTLTDPILLDHPADIVLTKHLLQFPEIIDAVIQKATPHLICTYLYELAGHFSSFYEQSPILNQDDTRLRNSRLKICAFTARVLKMGLSLLGISTLNRM